MINNMNTVSLRGKVMNTRLSNNEQHLSGTIEVKRESGTHDLIPFEMFAPDNELLTRITSSDNNTYVQIQGQYRSRDTIVDNRLKLDQFVYVQDIDIVDNSDVDSISRNFIEIEGFVCKPPILRTTPSGKQIVDLLVACNYDSCKSAYIPCIGWGRVARSIGKLHVGSKIRFIGRVQSRIYTKNNESKVANEISISQIL